MKKTNRGLDLSKTLNESDLELDVENITDETDVPNRSHGNIYQQEKTEGKNECLIVYCIFIYILFS